MLSHVVLWVMLMSIISMQVTVSGRAWPYGPHRLSSTRGHLEPECADCGGPCVNPSRSRATTKQATEDESDYDTGSNVRSQGTITPTPVSSSSNSTATLFRISTHAQRGLNSHGISIPPFAYMSKPAPLSLMSAAPSCLLAPRNRRVRTRLTLWNGQS